MKYELITNNEPLKAFSFYEDRKRSLCGLGNFRFKGLHKEHLLTVQPFIYNRYIGHSSDKWAAISGEHPVIG